jgi:hypothetical protein
MIAADATLSSYFRDLNVVYFRGELPDTPVVVLEAVDHDPTIMGMVWHQAGRYTIELRRALVEGYEELSTTGVLLHEMTHLAVAVELSRRHPGAPPRNRPHGWRFHKHLRRLYRRGAPLERRDLAYAKLEPVEAFGWTW